MYSDASQYWKVDLIDKLSTLSARIEKISGQIETEEATKNAFIMPFIQALGYDIFDPTEVVPEYTADVGTKKNEKVDYAILQDGKPIILFECKWWGASLSETHRNQLFRYFAVTPVRIAILTNGIHYWFFSDLDEANKMDGRPFLELDLSEVNEGQIAELKKLSKDSFNIQRLLDTASNLKYTKAIKRILEEQLESPSEDFVRFFANQVSPGRRMTQAVKDEVEILTKKAFRSFLNDKINERLKSALTPDSSSNVPALSSEDEEEISNPEEIVTTEEELEGYHIVKSILRSTIYLSRVAGRDVKHYYSVLLDDNNRKPICRLRFNAASKKYLGIFDENKNEEKILLNSLDDIYSHADKLKRTALFYDQKPSTPSEEEQTIS